MCVFVERLIQKATFLHQNFYLVDKHTYRTTVLHITSCFVEKLGQRSSPNKKGWKLFHPFYLQMLDSVGRVLETDEDRDHEVLAAGGQCAERIFHVGTAGLVDYFEITWSIGL